MMAEKEDSYSLTCSHQIIEQSPATHDLLINAHYYLIKISRVEDREIFKICLEYWAQLVNKCLFSGIAYEG